MKSKYPLDAEFDYIEDNGTIPTVREELDAENAMCKEDAESRSVEGRSLVERRFSVEGYDGTKVPVRFFEPVGETKSLPCIVYFHGGGFLYTLQGHQVSWGMKVAELCHCKVAVVDYRLSPDYPFPYGLEDCYAAFCWIADNAEELGIDEGRIAVMGDSSGGAYAASICQMSRDRKGPKICYQILIYPVTDNRMNTESMKVFTDTPIFSSGAAAYMWDLYLGEKNGNPPPYAVPMLADSFANLPPAYIETAEFDCLRDEGKQYGKKLLQAGVLVELNETKGSFHGFDCEENAKYTASVQSHRIEIIKNALK